MGVLADLKGKRFGKLLVLSLCRERAYCHTVWLVKCDCGKKVKLMGWQLTYDKRDCCPTCTRPCYSRRFKPEWGSYCSMKTRCLDKNHSGYKWWGGRGIRICDRWLGEAGFVTFLKDMGRRPEGKTLDRRNPEGDYTPENCRWASPKFQNNNRRNNYTEAELKVMREEAEQFRKEADAYLARQAEAEKDPEYAY